jgi:hypothetical protein
MAKDAGQMHGLHQLMRSWLLSEDPYGLNNRIEPTMGTVPGAPAPPAPAPAAAPPSGDALRAQNYGRGAVDRELNYPKPPQVGSEAFQGARDPRAQAWGEGAVDKAVNPSPRYSEAPRSDRGQMWGEQAVEKAAQPQPLDMSGAPGYASPEEAQMTAEAAGRGAVAGALQMPTGDAIRAKAKKRLKDPQDPDERQAE